MTQDRKRIIFVCIRKDIYDSTKVIDLDLDENIEIKFDNILETNVDIKYKVKPEIEQLFNIWDEIISQMEIGQKMSPTILCNEFHSNYTEEEFNQLPQWKQDYINKNKGLFIYLDNPAGTKKRFGQKNLLKMPFHYGEFTEINNREPMNEEIIDNLQNKIDIDILNEILYNYTNSDINI